MSRKMYSSHNHAHDDVKGKTNLAIGEKQHMFNISIFLFKPLTFKSNDQQFTDLQKSVDAQTTGNMWLTGEKQ